MEKAKTKGMKEPAKIENYAQDNEAENLKKEVVNGTSGAAESTGESKRCCKPRGGSKKEKDLD